MNFVSCIILSRQTGSNPAAAMDLNIVALAKLLYVSCRSPDNDRPVDINSNAIGERFGAFACVYFSSDNTCVRAQRVLWAVRAAERELRVPERGRVRAAVPGLGARAPVRERALQVRVCLLEARLKGVRCWHALIAHALAPAPLAGAWAAGPASTATSSTRVCPHRLVELSHFAPLRLASASASASASPTLFAFPLPEQSPPYASCSWFLQCVHLEILFNLTAFKV